MTVVKAELFNFEQLLNDHNDRIISFSACETVNWLSLRKHVFILRKKLLTTKHSQWILATDSTLFFFVGLLALISAKKEILLPPNNLIGMLSETIQGAQAVLTDLDIEIELPIINLSDLAGDSEPDDVRIDPDAQFIQICTSGSTGEPKQIRKSLATLESELCCLERQWGELVNDKVVISTVSHQHIYGLLFRVLWPAMAKRTFMAENIEYPEQITSIAKQHGKIVLISSPAYLKRMASVLNKEIMQEYVKVIYSSGGPLELETAALYGQEFLTTPIEVLGSTETGGIAFRQQSAVKEVLWQKFDEVQLRREPTNGALSIKSPFCFSDDWYEMGDAVELKSETNFKLLGRLDRIVKLEEKRISLDRMEAVLGQHEFIEQAKVTVLPGHRTILGVVCRLSDVGQQLFAQLTRREFSERLRDYLAGYFDRVTLPRKWRYVPDFPYNSQGKLTQAELARLFDEEQHD